MTERKSQIDGLNSFLNRSHFQPVDRLYTLNLVQELADQGYPLPDTTQIYSENPLIVRMTWRFGLSPGPMLELIIQNLRIHATSRFVDGSTLTHKNPGPSRNPSDFRPLLRALLSHPDLGL